MRPEDVDWYCRTFWEPSKADLLDAHVEAYPFSLRGARVLDLGAGPGAYCAAFLRAGAESVVWQDAEPRFLDEARRRLAPIGRVRFELRDMMDLPYPRESFDAVFLLLALHWARDEGLLLRRLGALLAPGGWLVLSMHNARRALASRLPWRTAAHLAAPPLAVVLRRKVLRTPWVFESLTRRRLRAAGLAIVEWRRPNPQTFEAFCRRPDEGER